MKIHCTVYGQGRPLVFFHGWGFDQSVWSSLRDVLMVDYRVYLVDLPGFGLSPMMGWSSFKSELLEIVPNPFALAGWSMGGLLATRFASESPEHLTHLINIATSPRFVQEEQWPGIDKHLFNAFYQNLLCDPIEVLSEFIAIQLNIPRIELRTHPLPNNILKRFERSHSTEALSGGLNILLNWDMREALSQLTIPVCYLFGRLDKVVPKATYTMMMQQFPAFNYVLFPKAGHVPFLSHQTLFVQELNRFLGPVDN